MNALIAPVGVTFVGVLLGADATAGGGVDFQGLAALITSVTGFLSICWVIFRGSRKKDLSADDLDRLLKALEGKEPE